MRRWFSLFLFLAIAFPVINVAAESEAGAVSFPAVTGVSAQTHVSDYGQEVTSFVVTFASDIHAFPVSASNIVFENNKVHPLLPNRSLGATDVSISRNTMEIAVDPFLFSSGFVASCVLDGKIVFSFDASTVTEAVCSIADLFERHADQAGLHYRLFLPEIPEPLPLIIWFHGGGEGGEDNMKQLMNNRGAVCWAEPAYQVAHPCAVLAPQSNAAWSDEELDAIADVVKSLIDAGKVDASRVYATGLAAQQATLRFCAKNSDMLAAALPMIYWKEFDSDFSTLGKLPIWISIAESDFTGEAPNVLAFVDYLENTLGNTNVKCTIYTDDEMHAYGLFGGLYHWGWVPTINNPEMIDWLFSHSK